MKIAIFFSARLTARILPSFRLISSHFRRSVILEVNLTFFYLHVLCRICLRKTCRKKCRIQKLLKKRLSGTSGEKNNTNSGVLNETIFALFVTCAQAGFSLLQSRYRILVENFRNTLNRFSTVEFL